MPAGSSRLRAGAPANAWPGRDDDDRDIARLGAGLHGFEPGESIHFRHYQIQQDQIRKGWVDGFQCLTAVAGGDRPAADLLYQPAVKLRRTRVGIDAQHTVRAAGRVAVAGQFLRQLFGMQRLLKIVQLEQFPRSFPRFNAWIRTGICPRPGWRRTIPIRVHPSFAAKRSPGIIPAGGSAAGLTSQSFSSSRQKLCGVKPVAAETGKAARRIPRGRSGSPPDRPYFVRYVRPFQVSPRPERTR
jgi:hypothetical protein